MHTTIPATDARKIFFQIIKKSSKLGSPVTITVDGEPKVVMISAEEFEGWKETLEILADKKLMKGIEEGLRDLQAKKTYTHEEVKNMFL
ncbi:type II toxin-antitoxin system Phd/YefM family antitoxin [Candidatus Peregrinibacteria bacterium]|nr:type II toxin-antitoxin system Phd/YefM family antitoxin [Candidatus Peregrinibacteria bacterium]